MNIKKHLMVLALVSLFLIVFTPQQVKSFEVDGFKNGMTKKEVIEILGKSNFDRIEDKEGTITAYDIPTKGTYRYYNFSFGNAKLVFLNKNFPPSMKNFIFLFDNFTTLYGKPVDSYTKISLETYGETRRISFMWKTQSETIDLDYSVFPNNDQLSISYTLGSYVYIK